MSSASEPKILELNRVSFAYRGQQPLIRELSLVVGEGEFIGLLGPNGSGKSTILKLAAGIVKPSSGMIQLWGRSLHAYPNRDRAKLLCYLPQLLDMQVPFKVRELVQMGLYPYDIPPHISADEALEIVGLTGKADAYINNLSGGERRRAFIAMTLIQGAGLILLDEPFANLDIKYQMELLRLLRDLREKKNISIVMALHDINLALQFEKVLLIKSGTVLGIGPPDTVLAAEMLRAAFEIAVSIKKAESGESYISYGSDA